MSEAVLRRIRVAVNAGAYDMTVHAVEEMAEDGLTVVDVESALVSATIVRTEAHDPRGTRFVLEGTAADNRSLVAVVLRFSRTERLLIITVYEVVELVPMSEDFNYECEYCPGIVHPKRVEWEAFKHKLGFVILEDVLIGVCDTCGSRCYSAQTLRQVHAIATGVVQPERTEAVPVAHAG